MGTLRSWLGTWRRKSASRIPSGRGAAEQGRRALVSCYIAVYDQSMARHTASLLFLSGRGLHLGNDSGSPVPVACEHLHTRRRLQDILKKHVEHESVCI